MLKCSVCGSKIEKVGNWYHERMDWYVHFNPWQRIYINKNYTVDIGKVLHNPESAKEYGLEARTI